MFTANLDLLDFQFCNIPVPSMRTVDATKFTNFFHIFELYELIDPYSSCSEAGRGHTDDAGGQKAGTAACSAPESNILAHHPANKFHFVDIRLERLPVSKLLALESA